MPPKRKSNFTDRAPTSKRLRYQSPTDTAFKSPLSPSSTDNESVSSDDTEGSLKDFIIHDTSSEEDDTDSEGESSKDDDSSWNGSVRTATSSDSESSFVSRSPPSPTVADVDFSDDFSEDSECSSPSGQSELSHEGSQQTSSYKESSNEESSDVSVEESEDISIGFPDKESLGGQKDLVESQACNNASRAAIQFTAINGLAPCGQNSSRDQQVSTHLSSSALSSLMDAGLLDGFVRMDKDAGGFLGALGKALQEQGYYFEADTTFSGPVCDSCIAMQLRNEMVKWFSSSSFWYLDPTLGHFFDKELQSSDI
ncbi:hypothetical protein BJ508DRAFT_316296, partial [Ascobolus immersus RN42]